MKKLITLLALSLLFSALQAQTANSSVESRTKDTISQNPPVSVEDAGGVNDNTGFVATIAGWYTDHLNYGTVSLLMGLESSFIPFPSEIVVPPAAWSACDEDSALHTTGSNWLNIALVILFATLGAIVGALINYYLAFFLGRPIIYWFADTKVGHLLLLSGEKVKKAESYFVEHGNSSTFIGRLVPVIRQLISIPAGLAKMPILPFVGYTALGATIWNIILAIVGYILHGQADLIKKYINEISWVLLVVGAVFIIYLIYKGVKKRKQKNQNPEA